MFGERLRGYIAILKVKDLIPPSRWRLLLEFRMRIQGLDQLLADARRHRLDVVIRWLQVFNHLI